MVRRTLIAIVFVLATIVAGCTAPSTGGTSAPDATAPAASGSAPAPATSASAEPTKGGY